MEFMRFMRNGIVRSRSNSNSNNSITVQMDLFYYDHTQYISRNEEEREEKREKLTEA